MYFSSFSFIAFLKRLFSSGVGKEEENIYISQVQVGFVRIKPHTYIHRIYISIYIHLGKFCSSHFRSEDLESDYF